MTDKQSHLTQADYVKERMWDIRSEHPSRPWMQEIQMNHFPSSGLPFVISNDPSSLPLARLLFYL